jgi:hypothetical protein
MESESLIKNTKQLQYNQVKGIIEELNESDIFCNLTVKVGHDNTRLVNLVCKKENFSAIKSKIKVGDKVVAKFFISSKFKFERWYTTASLLEINLLE